MALSGVFITMPAKVAPTRSSPPCDILRSHRCSFARGTRAPQQRVSRHHLDSSDCRMPMQSQKEFSSVPAGKFASRVAVAAANGEAGFRPPPRGKARVCDRADRAQLSNPCSPKSDHSQTRVIDELGLTLRHLRTSQTFHATSQGSQQSANPPTCSSLSESEAERTFQEVNSALRSVQAVLRGDKSQIGGRFRSQRRGNRGSDSDVSRGAEQVGSNLRSSSSLAAARTTHKHRIDAESRSRLFTKGIVAKLHNAFECHM